MGYLMSNIFRRKFMQISASATALPFLASKASAATHTVNIQSFAFQPVDLTVNAGDTVQFVNMDSAPHTATADNGTFDTGQLGNGAGAAVSFSGAGSFSYFCKFHPNMKGTITVV